MKIFIHAKPNAREEKVKKIDPTNFIVAVKEPPRQGRANQAIIKLLSKYLDITQSRIKITKGWGSKEKIIEII